MTAALALLVLLQADPLGRYLTDLEQSGAIPHETGSLEKIKEALNHAEEALTGGNPQAAATLLYGIVDSPRYADWNDSADYEEAEFLLGRALLGGGAYRSAERYFLRIIARGPKQPYFIAAYRGLVDGALESK